MASALKIILLFDSKFYLTDSISKNEDHESSFNLVLFFLATLFRISRASSCLFLVINHLGLSGIKLNSFFK
jgi:hypothetical protein